MPRARRLSAAISWWLGGLVELVWPEQVKCALCGGDRPHPVLAPAEVCLACAAQLFFLPGHPCRRCARPVPSPSPGPLCDECASALSYRRVSVGFDRAVTLGVYQGKLATWIRRLKYDGRSDLGMPLGYLLAWCVEARLARLLDDRPLVIIPVPLHPERLAERGFNQAALIARGVASALGLEMREDLLRRVRQGTPQAALGRNQRLHSLDGAFAACGRPRRPGTWDFLLVDDVLTTGATLDACALALKRQGAGRVTAAVLAAGIPRRLWGVG